MVHCCWLMTTGDFALRILLMMGNFHRQLQVISHLFLDIVQLLCAYFFSSEMRANHCNPFFSLGISNQRTGDGRTRIAVMKDLFFGGGAVLYPNSEWSTFSACSAIRPPFLSFLAALDWAETTNNIGFALHPAGCHRHFIMGRLWWWCGHPFWSKWNSTNSHVGKFDLGEPLAAQTKTSICF